MVLRGNALVIALVEPDPSQGNTHDLVAPDESGGQTLEARGRELSGAQSEEKAKGGALLLRPELSKTGQWESIFEKERSQANPRRNICCNMHINHANTLQ
jgi:hypothetical protein